MSYTSGMPKRINSQTGQAMAEAAVAIPIVVLLFAGCVQLVQIGLAKIVVMEAAFEAGRQAGLDQGRTDNAGRVAREICAGLGSGTTTFTSDDSRYTVTHRLKALFPVLKKITVSHSVPQTLFLAHDPRGGNE